MKALVWGVFVVLMLGWTGLAWVSAELTQWMLTGLGTGEATQAAQTVATWPVPAWLSLWISPEFVTSMQAMLVDVTAWVSAIFPTAQGLSSVIVVLIWVCWGIGALTLLALAVGLHWFASRLNRGAAVLRSHARP